MTINKILKYLGAQPKLEKQVKKLAWEMFLNCNGNISNTEYYIKRLALPDGMMIRKSDFVHSLREFVAQNTDIDWYEVNVTGAFQQNTDYLLVEQRGSFKTPTATPDFIADVSNHRYYGYSIEY